MARYRLVEEDTGCCNLVIWDFLLTLAAAGFSVYYGFEKTIHPAWCFVIGLVAAILLVALMNIRILGKIIQILLSAFWSLVATSLATSLFHLDTLWQIVVFIVLTIIFIGLHMVSAHKIGIGENAIGEVEPIIFESTSSPSANTSDVNREITQLTQRYESLGQEREHIMQQAVQMLQRQEHAALRQAFEENNRIWQEGSSKLETLAEKLEQQNQITEIYATIGVIRDCLDQMDAANKSVAQMLTEATQHSQSSDSAQTGFDPFAGCDTLEKLEQRYRQLTKSFHPDTESGDTQSMQYINAEYERRKREFRS